MAKSMLENRYSYFTPIGFLDDYVKKTELPIPVLGNIDDIYKYKQDKLFSEILIAMNNISYETIHIIIEKCKSVVKPIHIMSDLYGIIPIKFNLKFLKKF